ncbi:hypothetical protein DP939_44435 [Spongiactinospora rosea]|uniref:Uncharacterized protein n=1 Tax=Spongiactinospora rosea TaxID=2248750 RepID=A0A366LE60_9ACTN|nr:hypothetical protein [Spongiactinospora rosea]RBQ12151.1 hypothetical protein DP939_44435 [Spongiactinospora rosea]
MPPFKAAHPGTPTGLPRGPRPIGYTGAAGVLCERAGLPVQLTDAVPYVITLIAPILLRKRFNHAAFGIA